MCLIYEFSSCLVVQFTKMDPEEEKVLAKRRRDAERKRLQRAAYSQEKKDEIKKKCREHMRKIRSERNAMQNEHDRKKRCIASSNMEEGKKESIRKKRREYMAAVRANMTDKELEEGRKLGRQRAAAARANMTQEQLEEARNPDRRIQGIFFPTILPVVPQKNIDLSDLNWMKHRSTSPPAWASQHHSAYTFAKIFTPNFSNKIRHAHSKTSHICLHTTHNLIVFTYKYMYANPLTSVVSIQILPPFLSSGHR